jgi:hypothetical protein
MGGTQSLFQHPREKSKQRDPREVVGMGIPMNFITG